MRTETPDRPTRISRLMRSPSAAPECRMSSEWSEWSSCGENCLEAGGGGAKRKQQRSHHRLIDFYSESCTQPTEASEDCTELCGETSLPSLPHEDTATTERDCLVTAWSEWSSCSLPCGSGVHNRTRSILRQSSDDARPCPPLFEEEPCGLSLCRELICLYTTRSQLPEICSV